MLVFGVDDGNVDFEVRYAHVATAVVAVCGKLLRNKLAYTLFVYNNFVAADGNIRPALFGKLEEGFKSGNPARGGARQIYHRVAHRRENYHLFPRPRNRNVEPAPAAELVQRPEVQRNFTQLVGAVADRKQYNVPFVALNVFEVFYEQRLLPVICRVLELLFGNLFREQPFYIYLLRRTESYHAYT